MKNDNATLRLLALLLIGLMAGPEIGIAMEMTMLLEVLGAVMFFTAFSVGARMLIADLTRALRDYLCPPFITTFKLPVTIVYAGSRFVYVFGFSFAIGAYLLALGGGTLV